MFKLIICTVIFFCAFAVSKVLVGVNFLMYGIMALCVMAAILPRMWKLFAVSGVIFLVSFIIIEACIIGQSGGDSVAGEKYIIVLGAGLYGETPSRVLASRLDSTCTYMMNNPESVAVLCGGQGADEWISEAEAMRRYLVLRGIADDRLILEDGSINTIENMKNAAKLLGNVKTAAIVTNDFHLYRAKKLAARYGIAASGISAPTPNLPLLKENYYFREYFSVIFMWRK